MQRTDKQTIRKMALAAAALVLMALTPVLGASESDIPRTHDGKPDLTGTYDVATLTPLARSSKFGDKATLTPEEAEEYASYWVDGLARDHEASDPDRDAPEEGGTGTLLPEFAGAAGGVGGYNAFYVDIGNNMFTIDGEYRTSIIVEPPSGRFPALTEEAKARMKEGAAFRHQNTGKAWWVEKNLDVGPYDDPELRPTGERCLLGFGSTAGPPALPVMYNNMKRIVQTEDEVVILNEMNHDARVIRLDSEHPPENVRYWLGDSIGWWEGDTLVVDTANFGSDPALSQATDQLHVVERFTRIDNDTLLYRFTVEDPGTWTESWTGEYPWPAAEGRVYEYACHEGNYAMGGILRGARLLEKEAIKSTSSSAQED